MLKPKRSILPKSYQPNQTPGPSQTMGPNLPPKSTGPMKLMAADEHISDGSHLDAITVPVEPVYDPPPASPDGPEPLPASGATVSRDVFWANFQGTFSIPNFILPHPIECLPVASDDATARAASDELYDLCLETPWLRFLVEPESKWVKRIIVIGSFAVPKAMAVSAELKGRGAPAPASVAEPAGDPNDNIPGGAAKAVGDDG